MKFEAWNGFKEGAWTESVDVKDFIHQNYEPYEGDESFLAPPTSKTKALYQEVRELILEEIKKGVIDVETYRVSGIDNFEPVYIDR